jgi:hypothetical protein
MPDDIHQAFRMALTGHTIDGVKQEWGQLMGSIVSFVILCIVNVSVIRFSYELCVGQRTNLRALPATVNGDDGLVRAPESFLGIWEDVARVAGLIPSLGKVYTHPTYANINSTSFEWSSTGFSLIPYVNMGLVYGFQRSTINKEAVQAFDSLDERAPSIGSRHRTLIASCPPHLRVRVHEAFLKHNAELLSKLRGVPFFIAEEYGGLGLETIRDTSRYSGDIDDWDSTVVYGPEAWQLTAVQYLSDHPRSLVVSRLPTEAPIQVRSTWTRLLPFRNLRERTQYDMTEDDIGLLDVSAYYIVPSLVSRELVRPGLPILRANQSAWRRLKRRFAPVST